MVANVLFHPVHHGRHYGIRTIWTIYYLPLIFLSFVELCSFVRSLATPATCTSLIIFSDRVVSTDKYNLLHPFRTSPSIDPLYPLRSFTTSPHHVLSFLFETRGMLLNVYNHVRHDHARKKTHDWPFMYILLGTCHYCP